MSNRIREDRGTKRAGVSVGGQFARGQQSEAGGVGLAERGAPQHGIPSDQVTTEWTCPICHATSTCSASDLSSIGSPLCFDESCSNFDAELEFSGATGLGGSRAEVESVRFSWKCPDCGAECTTDTVSYQDGGSPTCWDDSCTNHGGDLRLETVEYDVDLSDENDAERDLARRQYVEDLSSDAEQIAQNLERSHALTDSESAAVRRYVASFDTHGVSDESASAAARLSEALDDANFSSEAIALDAAVTRAKLRDDPKHPLTLTEVWNLGFMHRHKPLDELTLERVSRPEFSDRFLVGLEESQRRRPPFHDQEV